jgi:hypothetical protein
MPVGKIPPLAATPAPVRVIAPLSVSPGTPAPPRTDHYTVESHECLAEDTWEKLAKTKYGNESAAAALKEFNRGYFRASDRLHREGTMAPGEKVFIPPVAILERYGYLPAPVIKPVPETSGTPLPPVKP